MIFFVIPFCLGGKPDAFALTTKPQRHQALHQFLVACPMRRRWIILDGLGVLTGGRFAIELLGIGETSHFF